MKDQKLLGKLTIQENISPIGSNKIDNTFVVHIPNPLSSYYSRFTEVNRPNSIVFITKEPVSFEKILRVTSDINEKNDIHIYGAKCEVFIGKRKLYGMRIKGLKRYTDIEGIQNEYKNAGFDFSKHQNIQENTDALVRVNKFFNLKELGDGIHQSPNNENRFYIEIPHDMHWNDFRDLTFDIKNNVSVTNYDIAKGMLYKDNSIVDILRVIKPNITLDMVKEIQQKYLERLGYLIA